MKKILISMFLVSFIIPSYALCPVDNGEKVCTLPDVRQEYRPTYSGRFPVGEQPSTELQPLQRKDPLDQMRAPNNSFNYNSGCQFGVCINETERRFNLNENKY